MLHVGLSPSPEVLALLAALMFSLPLSFEPLDHVELFSGKMAVTYAEMQVWCDEIPKSIQNTKYAIDCHCIDNTQKSKE